MSAATGEPVDLDAIRSALAKVGSSCNHLGCDNPDCAWHRGPEWLAALLAEVARLRAALAAAERFVLAYSQCGPIRDYADPVLTPEAVAAFVALQQALAQRGARDGGTA